MRDPALWSRLQEYMPGNSQFAGRLAEEQGWTEGHTKRVIDEYRRFLYLAVTHDGPVSPSPDIDKAWHLHLIHTRDYWGVLCPLLGKELHHTPAEQGQAPFMVRQYAATRALYAQEFGYAAPREVWRRPSDDAHLRVSGWLSGVAVLGLFGAAVLWAIDHPLKIAATGGFLALLIASIIYAQVFRVRGRKDNSGSGCGSGGGGSGGGSDGGGGCGGD